MPGLSVHDIVFVETSSPSLRHKPAHRWILLWKHANFDNMRLKISNWTRDFISSNTTFTPVENLATIITDSLSKLVVVVGSPFSPKLHLAQGITAADSLYRFVRIMSMPHLFFLALVKTGITLASIQLMHHPLTPLSGS